MMKKILLGIFLFVTCLGLSGCNFNTVERPNVEMLYNNWYTTDELPNIENPFNESYNGMYTIKIDRNNEVNFTTIDGEKLTGTLVYEKNKNGNTINVKITFDNNDIVSGKLSVYNKVHYLNFNYNNYRYSFSSKKTISKEGFEAYRNKFNAFLRGTFVHNYFPIMEEVVDNNLYKAYTNFYQIDPGCGGPLVYTNAKNAVISIDSEKDIIDLKYIEHIDCTDYTHYGHHTHYTSNDSRFVKEMKISQIEGMALVKMDGTFEKIDAPLNGECLITSERFIYYFETESDDIKMNATSIEEAYENSKINNKQLQDIANIFDGSNNRVQEIDDKYLLIIKQQYLNELKKTHSDATLSDVIVNVYWSNETNYVLTIKDSFTDYPAVEKEMLIDGITIVYSGPKPIFIEVSNEYE